MERVRTYSRKPKVKLSSSRFAAAESVVDGNGAQKENRPHRDWRQRKKAPAKSFLDSDSESEQDDRQNREACSKAVRFEGQEEVGAQSDSESELESTLADFEALVQRPMERSHGSFVNIMVPREIELARQLRLAKYCRRLKSGFECKWVEGYLWITNASTSRNARVKMQKRQREMRVRKAPISSEHTQALQQQSLRMLRRFSLYHAGVEQEDVSVEQLSKVLQRTKMEEIPEAPEVDEMSAEAFEPVEADRPRQDTLAADQLTQIVQFLDPLFIVSTCQLVCQSWLEVCRIGYNCAVASQITSKCLLLGDSRLVHAGKPFPKSASLNLAHLFPTGSFLGDGSFKQVYKVHNRFRDQAEAVSVMHLNKIAQFGNAAMVSEELSVSLMLSELVTSQNCPFYIETYQIFESATPPPADAWNVPEREEEEAVEEQTYVYCNMELCDGGDLEEFLKRQENEILDEISTRSALFQMVYALYMGQKVINLRHFDIKLLNFFVKTNASRNDTLHETYTVGSNTFALSANEGHSFTIKLADYGTAETAPGTLNARITQYQFTTLENTPIEFLLFQDSTQAFSADMFALGLCVLHLFTGSMPYEEIMEEVKCPDALKTVLDRHWKRKGFAKTVKQILDEPGGEVLYDTLYRYLVLIGIRSSESVDQVREQSGVFKEVARVLGFDGTSRGRRSKR